MDEQEIVLGKVLTKSQFTEKVIRIKIKNIHPVHLDYKAGQYIQLKTWSKELVPYYIFRYYPEINAFEIAINIDGGNESANYIKSIGIGDDVEYTPPQGELLLDSEAKDIYYIGEGTFISPFISYLYHLDRSTQKPNLSLFWGVKEEKELFLADSIYAFSTSMNNFSYTIFMSEGTSVVTHRPGRVVDAIQNIDLTEGALFYVCGEDIMVGEVKAVLKNKGVSEERIVSEKPKRISLDSTE
ncbi:FAD-dependent oxidoreductase [Patescibacteria group bacterium]